ncbi:hypothetical protein E2C01_019004 [Portunus trituberculatus]|uniref:Uncharacterized protein n=1 Tax=Portunus trituberculatus TaxID=210409 RepID=A0A5B7DW54_PORTR|nr:hypothetical protein [Portunus trituberculatus]
MRLEGHHERSTDINKVSNVTSHSKATSRAEQGRLAGGGTRNLKHTLQPHFSDLPSPPSPPPPPKKLAHLNTHTPSHNNEPQYIWGHSSSDHHLSHIAL